MLATRRRRTSVRTLVLALAVLSAILFPIPAAHGQGTDGALSDPIGGRELLRYADRLELSDRQRLALEQMHDAYRTEFAALRDGEIAGFMRTTAQMTGRMPKRDEARDLFREWDRLRGKVARIDDGLFDRLAPILDERQAALLPRLRLARERARTGGNGMQMMGGGRITDISDLWYALDLDDDARAATDPTVADYEHRLTAGMRKIAELSARMFMDMFDALDAAGFGELDMTNPEQDPEELQRLMTFYQETWRDLTARSRDAAQELHELNDRTFRTLRAGLPPDAGFELRNRYYERAYPQLRRIIRALDEELLTAVLEDDTLTDDELTTIASARAEMTARLELLLTEAISLQQKMREEMNPFDMSREKMRERSERIEAIRQETETVAAEALLVLERTFGFERADDLQRRARKRTRGEDDGGEAELAAAVAATAAPNEAPDEPLPRHDPLLPPALLRSDVRELAQHVGITREEQALLDELHDQYRAAFREMPELKAIETTARALWTIDEKTGARTPPTSADFTRLDQARRAATAAVRAQNDRFFDDVAVAIADGDRRARLERVRRMHVRRGLAGHDRMYRGFGGAGSGDGGATDVIAFLVGQDADETLWTGAADLVTAYESDAAVLFAERHDAALALRAVNERWSFEAQKAMEDAGNDVSAQLAFGRRYQEVVGPAMERDQDLRRQVKALNERTLADVLATLADDEAQSLRRAWRRSAYPELTNDPMAVDRHLTSALELGTLTPDQRRQVEDLAMTYRPDYERLTTAMIDATDAAAYTIPNMQDAEAIQEWTERRRTLERARFERNDLNFRAIGRLRAVLSADQIIALGGLPSPEKDGGNGAVVW